MRIALLGGTGDIGEGLALRWAFHTDHEVIVGSRDPEKARAKADEYETELSSRGRDVKVNGFTNEMAADRASVVVLAVPPYHVSDTVEAVSDSLSEGDVLVTPAAGIKRDDDGFHYHPPKAGSVTALVADAAPDGVPVVGAFHNLAAGRLADLDADLGIDTLLVADDPDAKETVRLLADGIDGLRPLDAGGLANASEIEALTPLLINVAQNNEGMHDLGIEFK
ncbi:NADPH-dependent F420 reductase [Haloferax larsenii]|uniref:NADPH-dependent F420 reductase n=1 Tax=Haloferax larsenii TaxID=302484 RepID=A0A1H7FMU0_HALLR|nr:NADPH-dependent F420 reductase [Haloferax larsenii]ELZ75212.1 NADPH-dependent F420 reductase [Haloferax larsenii JCM 13917]UVE51570.1 NADPH-dependent F420 reductase [Haloferax larsenii]SEK26547.1 reduced coenzyme F420:NADP oxidoreductase [Haloferax larsenii]